MVVSLDALLDRDPESLTEAEVEHLVAIYDEVSEVLYRGMLEAFSGPGDWHVRFARAVEATLAQIRYAPESRASASASRPAPTRV